MKGDARPSPISRALRRAMALIQGVLEDNCQPCRNLVAGSTPRELRVEFNEYHALLEKIEPWQKGKKGPVGEKPQVAPPPGASL